jgi:hypothetical protein
MKRVIRRAVVCEVSEYRTRSNAHKQNKPVFREANRGDDEIVVAFSCNAAVCVRAVRRAGWQTPRRTWWIRVLSSAPYR